MNRTAHLAGFAALLAFGAVPLFGAASASVSGLVRDSAGVPQIGAQVELLRPDLTVISSTYTNDKGEFLIASILPGEYALKAMGTSFLPSLREGIRVRRGTVVNLTLNTLYEVMQWLPSQPRGGKTQNDDWAWTLRSAANRPLLRWLEDGPLVVVSDGTGAAPRLKARLVATGQAGTFGESGERISSAVEETPSNSRELLASVDFAPHTDAGMESMLGFRQDLGFAGSVQSVAAIAIHPEEMDGSGDQGLNEAAIRTSEAMQLGDELEADAGSTQVLGRLAGLTGGTVVAALPYATVAWHDGNSTTLRYRLATMVQDWAGSDDTQAAAWLPPLAMRNGNLVVERGLHQEIGWERRTDKSSLALTAYSDHIDNPILEAMQRVSSGEPAQSFPSGSALFDPASGLLRAAGPGFSAAGIVASLERRLPRGNKISFNYASGSALVMPALPSPSNFNQLLSSVRTHHSQAYSLSLSGTLEGTGTRWRASYRWQSDDPVTEVAPFMANADEPFCNIRIRQPIHLTRDGSGGFEALLDVRNLLAEGYRPYILSDGSVLIFAQDQRGIRGGLAFTF
jgi:hypothetical protein